jgi:hypothetical protein
MAVGGYAQFLHLNLDYLGCPTWLPYRSFYAPSKEKELQSFSYIAGVAKINSDKMSFERGFLI